MIIYKEAKTTWRYLPDKDKAAKNIWWSIESDTLGLSNVFSFFFPQMLQKNVLNSIFAWL